MAQTPEGKVKLMGAKIIKEYDPYYFCPVTGGFGSSGQFDVVVLYKGWFIGVEYKSTCQKAPTLLQSKNATKAISSRAIVMLLHKDNVEELRYLLEDIRNERKITPRGRSIWPFDSVV